MHIKKCEDYFKAAKNNKKGRRPSKLQAIQKYIRRVRSAFNNYHEKPIFLSEYFKCTIEPNLDEILKN